MHLTPRVFALALLLAPSVATAQVATPPDTTIPEVPAPGNDGATSADPCAGQPGGTGANQTLSGQLSTCDGVLTPPDTGAAGIEAPAPDPNPETTPVIPPGVVPDQPSNDGAGSPPNNDGG